MPLSFDDLAPVYDNARGVPAEAAMGAFVAHLARAVHATATTRFLDAGAGTGRIALPLARAGFAVTALDASVAMLAALRAKATALALEIPTVAGDVTALPFPDASFDVVYSSYVLYLVPEWRRALAETRRVLCPGGVYVHCSERVAQNPLAQGWDLAWQAELRRRGHFVPWHAVATDDEMLHALAATGATLSSVPLATTRHVVPLADAAATYADRVRPLYPAMPDADFAAAVASLRSWATAHNPTGKAAMITRIHAIATLARWDG